MFLAYVSPYLTLSLSVVTLRSFFFSPTFFHLLLVAVAAASLVFSSDAVFLSLRHLPFFRATYYYSRSARARTRVSNCSHSTVKTNLNILNFHIVHAIHPPFCDSLSPFIHALSLSLSLSFFHTHAISAPPSHPVLSRSRLRTKSFKLTRVAIRKTTSHR